jgi:hypothetical protein
MVNVLPHSIRVPKSMPPSSFMRRFPKTTLVTINVCILMVVIGLTEITLRVFFPMTVNVAGFVRTENGKKYGWGFNPNQLIRIDDPDTGDVYLDYANSHGWRDVDRSFEKPQGVFRILILGDSVTFGYIVPAEKVFTRVLEKRLRAEGANVEVLNVSYSGWGTHQQYEALKNHGIRYKPDLVIFNATANDLGENQHYKMDGKFGRRVPFFYALDGNGSLKRQNVPEFNRELNAVTRKYIISTSQILTRLWIIRNKLRARVTWSNSRYAIRDNTVFRLKTCIAPLGYPAFVKELSEYKDKPITDEVLRNMIGKHSLDAKTTKKVLRMAEDRHSNREWPISNYHGKPAYAKPDLDLFFALLTAAAELSRSVGAEFAASVNRGRGTFDGQVEQCGLFPGDEQFYNYMLLPRLVENFAHKKGIGFARRVVPVTGARNDPHPNIDGNAAMAENFYRYLIKNHGKALRTHGLKN